MPIKKIKIKNKKTGKTTTIKKRVPIKLRFKKGPTKKSNKKLMLA